MINLDKIPVRYGPYTVITDINERADQYWRCRSPARARRRLKKKGIVGKILLGMPSLSLVGTVLRIHPYLVNSLKLEIGWNEAPGLSPEEVIRRAIRSSITAPMMWKARTR